MPSDDEKLEGILADPWLARPRTRWSLSLLFVLVTLFAFKPVIVQNLIARIYAGCKKAADTLQSLSQPSQVQQKTN